MLKKWFKKVVLASVSLSAVISIGVGATSAAGQTLVKIGVVGDSENVIWDVVQENLGEEIEIELVSFSDGIFANSALADGDLDLTAFQHNAFLQQEISDKGYAFEAIADTYVSPLNIYSENITDISELKAGDTILIPDNATNRGRALIVLDRAGLLTVDPEKGNSPDVTDIIDNPLGLEIVESDPAIILQALPDVAAGITNSNLALDFGLNPVEDAIFSLELDPQSEDILPYVNIIVARTEDQDNAVYQEIVAAYHQQNVADFILEHYEQVNIPVFEVKE